MRSKNKALMAFSAFVYLFLLVPLVIITGTAFGSAGYLKFPPTDFSLKWVQNIFEVEMFMRTFGISMQIAVVGTLIALLVGIPAAHALSGYSFKGKSYVEGLFLSPVIVPGIVLGFSLLKFLIIRFDLEVMTSLLIGHTVLILPYIVRVISSSLENFDYAIEEASISLGCSGIKTFFIVVLPNVRAGVLAAFILAFINSFNNVPV